MIKPILRWWHLNATLAQFSCVKTHAMQHLPLFSVSKPATSATRTVAIGANTADRSPTTFAKQRTASITADGQFRGGGGVGS